MAGQRCSPRTHFCGFMLGHLGVVWSWTLTSNCATHLLKAMPQLSASLSPWTASTSIFSSGYSNLTLACMSGNLDCVNHLLDADGIDVNHGTSGGATALYMSTTVNHEHCVRALCKADGININHQSSDDGMSALALAAQQCRVGCVTPILEAKDVLVNAKTQPPYAGELDDYTALHHACADIPEHHVMYLRDEGVEYTEEQYDAMSAACVSALLIGGACRFATNASGKTPEQLALSDAVRSLFRSGVDYWERQRHRSHS